MNPVSRRSLLLVPVAVAGLVALGGCDRGGASSPPATPAAVTTPAAETVAFEVNVQGMHCSGCADAIAATLKQVEGVVDCDVSFERGSAQCRIAGDEVAPQVVKAIAGMGYHVDQTGVAPMAPIGGEPAGG